MQDKADIYEICDLCREPGALRDTQWTRKAMGDPDGPDWIVRLCSDCYSPVEPSGTT